MTDLIVWKLERGVGDPIKTTLDAQAIEDIDWDHYDYFWDHHHFFATADLETPDVPVAEVPEETQAEITRLANWLYAQEWGAVGGPFHIVTDDNNLESYHIAYCMEETKGDSHWGTKQMSPADKEELLKLGELLLSITYGARHVALRAAEAAEGAY